MKQRIVRLTLLLMAGLTLSALGENSAEARLTELGYWHDEIARDTAIRNFQVANELLATSVLDTQTLECLFGEDAVSEQEYLRNFYRKYSSTELSLGSVRNGVSGLQDALRRYGYLTGDTDNAYGEETQKAVARFQTANGLRPTGEADADTLLRLYEGEPVTWDEFLSAQCAIRGDSGAHVKRLQTILKEMGYFPGTATGSYGEWTLQAVAQFQAANGLTVTGNVDFTTAQMLHSDSAKRKYESGELRLGSKGDDIADIQTRLCELGYICNTDGTFDAQTRNMVLLFQIANDISTTGSVNAETLEKIRAEDAISYEALQSTNDVISDEMRAGILQEAKKLLGQKFVVSEQGLFHGFAFVQYVCALRGVVILSPNDAIQNSVQYESASENIPTGAVMIMEQSSAEGVCVRMGICIGEGYMLYADAETGWVTVGRPADMDCEKLYIR